MRGPHERDDAGLGIVLDAAQPNPSEAFGLQQLDGQNDQHLGRPVLAAHRGEGLLAIGDGEVGLIDLDLALQAVPIGAHHGPAKPMQHGPGGLVAAQPQHALQAQSADALLLVGQVPRRGQPHTQRRAGLVEDGAGSDGALVGAAAAHQAQPTGAIGGLHHGTARADESLRPAQPLQIPQARLLAGEPIQKFVPVAGIVLASFWRYDRLDIHPVVPVSLELRGYPLWKISIARGHAARNGWPSTAQG